MTFWRNDRSLELVDRHIPLPPHRPFLIFLVPHPSMPSPLLALDERERNFDIAARFYAEPGCNEGLLRSADYVMTGGLSKFHAASLFLETCGLHDAYEGYLFLDGDLEFDAARIDRFLSFVKAAGLDLAQPAVTRDSYCYWNMAYHQPCFLFRQTSFVEVMAPYLSRAALLKTKDTFTRSISTYGLDLVWPSLIGGEAIGVIDAFQMRHRERVDHVSGKFYQYLKSIGVDLDEEERLLLAQYGVAPEHAHSRRGYFWKRNRRGAQARSLMSVALPGIEKSTNRQIRIDLSMRAARFREARSEPRLQAAIAGILDDVPLS